MILTETHFEGTLYFFQHNYCNASFAVSKVTGVKINLIHVPEVAQAGHSVHLTCDYDLERARLYQVKWYKGSHEFFRYSPRDDRKIKLFLVENLHVDVSSLPNESLKSILIVVF